MCDECKARAQKIADLADYFRAKCDEAGPGYYFDRMNEAASSLNQQAVYFSTRCRCGEIVGAALAANMPDKGPRALPNPHVTIRHRARSRVP